MDPETAALAVLAKRSFDRTSAEVQQLAAWLCQTCHPFFSSMRQDVVEHLCAHVGHAWVDESQPVYAQGQIGDCMYIITKGYCSVLKHAETSTSSGGAASTAQPTSTAAAGLAGNSTGPSTPRSRRNTGSQAVSRRATVEMQTQQFALATGAVGASTGLGFNPSRRGTAEVVGAGVLHPAGSSVLSVSGCGAGAVASRRVSATVGPAGQAISQQPGSRRVTAEQVVQQRLAESAQLGWLSRGDSFGEAALVNPSQQRPVSVAAGGEGVMLLVLDRATFSKLQQQAQEGQALAAAAVHAVLAAACRPILRVAGRGRSAEEVETLAELFSGLEAFRCMPQPVRTRLAKACQGLQLPSGAVVFEEDDKGDAMYVVVSGALQVRARPLNTGAAAAAARGEQPQQDGQLGAAAGTGADAGGLQASSMDGGARKQRATTDAVCAGADRSSSGSGSGADRGVLGELTGSRRTTWEGVAFTAKEQSKLDAVRNALEAEKQQDVVLGTSMVTDNGAKQPGNLVERDGLYWTAKFMADATAAATSSDPQWGLEGGMTPLAAVFASKWRQQVRQQAVVHQAQTAAAEEEAADSKAYAAMEEMLGKAAAKAWKAARDNAANLANAAAAGNNSSFPGSSSDLQNNGQSPAALKHSTSSNMTLATAAAARGYDEAAVAAATVVAGGRDSDATSASRSTDASSPTSPTAAAASGLHLDEVPSASGDGAAAEAVPCTPRTAAAAAAQLLAAAAASTDPVEAVKHHLAALGVKDPADVSRTLMAEIGARANLEGLLLAVAAFLEKKGLPRRLNKKGSLKITRELNKRMLAGASWKGYSGSNSQGSSFNQHGADAADHSAPLLKGVRRVRHADLATDASSATDGDLCTEATGLSSCDWQSSLDAGSNGASMYGGMGAEDSMDGSLMDGIDLAGSTDTNPLMGPLGRSGAGLQERIAAHRVEVVASGGLCSCHCHQTSLSGQVAGAGTVTSCQCCSHAGQRQQHVPGAPAGKAGASESPECLTARFGPVIRTVGTGDSFGELALLQSTAVRTATVVVAPESPATAAAGCGDQAGAVAGSSSASSSSGGALLIKISRSSYDATVRALQVSALEDLLSFLSSLPPFSGLSREVLTSLAVFIRPVSTQPGQVLALAGQPADTLIIIQAGDVKLLTSTQAGRASSSDTSPSLSRSISSNAGGSNSSGAGQQPRSHRSTGTQPAVGAPQAGPLQGSSASGGSGDGGQQLGVGVHQLTAQQQLSGVQLAVLGPGSLLGENVLGYDPEQDPLAAIAAATSRRARQAATAAAAALTHHATAVAAAPCKLLVLSADDLRRFGRRVRAPLAEAAAVRRDWLQQRIAAVQVSHSTRSQAGPQPYVGRRVSGTATAALSPPIHGMSSLALDSKPGAAPGGLRQSSQGTAAAGGGGSGRSRSSSGGGSNGNSSGNGGSSGSSTSLGALWPGLAGLLHPVGTGTAATASAAAKFHSPGAAAAASRSQWQQQQWQKDAYGELMQCLQMPAQQQISVGDVTRLKQLVPAMQPPCVSELAAAARPFPAGMLTASSVAAAGRDGAKGLQQLLSSEPQQHGQNLFEGSQAAVGSPKWAVGPGGRVLPAAAGGSSCAQAAVAASGRRGPMAKHLERDSDA